MTLPVEPPLSMMVISATLDSSGYYSAIPNLSGPWYYSSEKNSWKMENAFGVSGLKNLNIIRPCVAAYKQRSNSSWRKWCIIFICYHRRYFPWDEIVLHPILFSWSTCRPPSSKTAHSLFKNVYFYTVLLYKNFISFPYSCDMVLYMYQPFSCSL